MPHKRAKRSLREKQRSQSGADLPPEKKALSNEDIPKGAARILFAAKIQEDFNEKKRKGEDQDGGRKKKKARKDSNDGDKGGDNNGMHILPGESLAHFNRRVENSMRGTVRSAMQASSAVARKVRKEEEEQAKQSKSKSKPPKLSRSRSKSQERDSDSDTSPDSRPTPQPQPKPKDFASLSTSAPKRLNDIVQAPPEIKKLPRGAKKKAEEREAGKGEKKSLKEGVMSMAQKAMMEEERERAIRLYREMKKKREGAV
ncbi:hypothetical protein K474DRAFT_278715 [Panus rudis PR-1116 ss-1]|nr:hypothetical protein K474DRAFT_278715 [Panus rudis PR-1116 ss-1]